MHLMVVLVFGMTIWRMPDPPIDPLIRRNVPSLACLAVLPLVAWLMARTLALRSHRRLEGRPPDVDAAQLTYHRASIALRFFAFAGFAAGFYLTRWPDLVSGMTWLPAWTPGAELLIVAPFFVTVLAIWHGLFPADQALRRYVVRARQWEHVPTGRVWSLGEYLLFNARHQLLTVAVPMIVILFAWTICDFFRAGIIQRLRFPWAPDALLALVAAGVFILSPALLKTIWSTQPLPPGPLRRRLERACGRAGLRCRDILVWRSHGMMINAAVMGLVPRVRYVLLSDALLDGLDEDGVEAVFGHEAGHIRHRHIQYFLLFAFVSVLIVSGIMEFLLRLAMGSDSFPALNELAIQGIGLLCVAILWATAFGWVSRRFERQADMFGAQVASPGEESCREPCGVHAVTMHRAPRTPHAVCASGARIFVSALDRVAVLNGIPHEEPSWRHSSIGSRMRFLTAMAGDPALAAGFQRRIRRIKNALWCCALVGLALGAAYTWWQPDYRELIYRQSLAPLGMDIPAAVRPDAPTQRKPAAPMTREGRRERPPSSTSRPKVHPISGGMGPRSGPVLKR